MKSNSTNSILILSLSLSCAAASPARPAQAGALDSLRGILGDRAASDVPAAAPQTGGMQMLFPRYTSPDTGPGRTLYVGGANWFRTPDGRIICLDIIRSDDKGRMALRVFLQQADGSFKGWIYEAPTSAWAPLATDRHAIDLSGVRNVLGRGDDWIAGSVQDSTTGLNVAFDLDVLPQIPGMGAPEAALRLVKLTATDYPMLRFKGALTVQGERMDIDSIGLASVHHGDRLPDAAWLATEPSTAGDPDATRLLLAAAGGDNLRTGAGVMRGDSLLYAYGAGEIPAFSLHIAPFGEPLDLGRGIKVFLDNVRVVPHILLDVPEFTGTADAYLVKPAPGPLPNEWSRKKLVPLGQVIVDYRGDEYIRFLPK